MAPTRPKPATHSDETPRTSPHGVARPAPGCATRPGRAARDAPRSTRWRARASHESKATAAMAALPGLCRGRRRAVWVDLAGRPREQVVEVGEALGLHPLIVEDVLEGNQRAKIETTDGVVHIVLFHLTYERRGRSASELDIVLGPGFLLTAHDAAWDPRAAQHLRAGHRADPQARPGPPAVGARRRHRRRLLPVRRPARRRHRRGPGRGRPGGRRRRRSSGSSRSSASSIASAARSARSARSSTS